jgi:hypothetical protein
MAHPGSKHLASGRLETDRERIMQKLRQAAEMVLEVFDNDYGQMAKDIAMAEMRQALHDREETNVNTLDTLKLALQCIDYHWDNPDHELEETPFVLETRRALRQAIDKEITLTPKDVAAIIEDMPQGMDADAFLVELANRAAKVYWRGLSGKEIFDHEWWDEETAFDVNKTLTERNT